MLMERSAAGFAVLEATGPFRWVNAAFAELVGWRCDRLVGIAFEDITHPEDVDAPARCARPAASR